MPYLLQRFDSLAPDATFPLLINDDTVDTTSTDLKIVGIDSLHYSNAVMSNFVYLCENFKNPSAPTQPLSGQVWFSSTDNVLRFWDGIKWRVIGTYVDTIAPGSAEVGDLWWNGDHLYAWNGTNWIEIGPQGDDNNYTSFEEIDGVAVLRIVVGGQTVALFSSDIIPFSSLQNNSAPLNDQDNFPDGVDYGINIPLIGSLGTEFKNNATSLVINPKNINLSGSAISTALTDKDLEILISGSTSDGISSGTVFNHITTITSSGTYVVPNNVTKIQVKAYGSGSSGAWLSGGGFQIPVGGVTSFTGNGTNIVVNPGVGAVDAGIPDDRALMGSSYHGLGTGGDFNLYGHGSKGGVGDLPSIASGLPSVYMTSWGSDGGYAEKLIDVQPGQTFNAIIGAGGQFVGPPIPDKNGLAGYIEIYEYTSSNNNNSETIKYTVPGIYTWTVPAGVNGAIIELWGAGGGCAGFGGASGSGGAYAKQTLGVIPGQVHTIVVGAGGLKNFYTGPGTEAFPGGDSSFDGTVIGGGGPGGAGGYQGGGVASGGDINLNGQQGADIVYPALPAATGGAGAGPGGGAGGVGGSAHEDGYAPGGGGGGTQTSGGFTGTAGNGADGQAILTFFKTSEEAFIIGGTYLWTCPANVTQILVKTLGGGGGGGGHILNDTVGAGDTGETGGNSSFDSFIIANGGQGGVGSNVNTYGASGIGGTTGLGDVIIVGNSGFQYQGYSQGGPAPLGGNGGNTFGGPSSNSGMGANPGAGGAGQNNAGAGGSASYSQSLISVNPGQTYTINVGAGGPVGASYDTPGGPVLPIGSMQNSQGTPTYIYNGHGGEGAVYISWIVPRNNNIVVFDKNGVYNWVVPEKVKQARISVWGGGAGGTYGNPSPGNGGGAGGFGFKIIDVVEGQNIQVIVGIGGSGGTSSTPATTGGDSAVDNLYAAFGGQLNGGGGFCSNNFDYTINGQSGKIAFNAGVTPGTGGRAGQGGGGGYIVSSPGAGGDGGNPSYNNGDGINGASGRVIIEYISFINTTEPKCTFSAFYDKNISGVDLNYNTSSGAIFPIVEFNSTNCYDNVTGIFTAPVDGIYQFNSYINYLFGVGESTNFITNNNMVRINDGMIFNKSNQYLGNNTTSYDSSTSNATSYFLQQGDQVTIVPTQSNKISDGRFSGFYVGKLTPPQ